MSNSPTVKKTFESFRVSCEKLGGAEAFDYYTIILNILAPFGGGMMDESGKDEMTSMYHKPTFWKDSMTEIAKSLRNPEVKDMVEDLLSTCSIQGEKLSLSSDIFVGNISLALDITMWVIQENFGDALDMGKFGLNQLFSKKVVETGGTQT